MSSLEPLGRVPIMCEGSTCPLRRLCLRHMIDSTEYPVNDYSGYVTKQVRGGLASAECVYYVNIGDTRMIRPEGVDFPHPKWRE